MAELPNITVEGSGPSEARRKKERESNYHILINTNKHPKTDSEAERMVNALEQAVQRVFSDPRSLERIIKFNIAYQHFDERFIQDVQVTHGPEVGSLKGRVHSHIILKIKHTSNISVQHSRQEIQEEILRTSLLDPWNVTNLRIKIELLRNNIRAAELYAAKDQTSSNRKRKFQDVQDQTLPAPPGQDEKKARS